MPKKQNHLDKHIELALEVSTLIRGALDATDEGVAIYLSRLAAGRSEVLIERLEAERAEVMRSRTPEEIERFARALDNVVPISSADGRCCNKVAGEV